MKKILSLALLISATAMLASSIAQAAPAAAPKATAKKAEKPAPKPKAEPQAKKEDTKPVAKSAVNCAKIGSDFMECLGKNGRVCKWSGSDSKSGRCQPQ